MLGLLTIGLSALGAAVVLLVVTANRLPGNRER